MTGGLTAGPETTIVRVLLPEPLPLLALRPTVKVPACVGVPEIEPLVPLMDRPGGRPLAPNVVAPLATIWKLNAVPTTPVVVVALVMTGALSE